MEAVAPKLITKLQLSNSQRSASAPQLFPHRARSAAMPHPAPPGRSAPPVFLAARGHPGRANSIQRDAPQCGPGLGTARLGTRGPMLVLEHLTLHRNTFNPSIMPKIAFELIVFCCCCCFVCFNLFTICFLPCPMFHAPEEESMEFGFPMLGQGGEVIYLSEQAGTCHLEECQHRLQCIYSSIRIEFCF